MTEQRRTGLKELQKMDLRIQEARQRIAEFDPRFEEVEEPALILEGELGTTRTRLQEMKLEERRLELSVDEKRTRRERLDERLGSVRNLRPLPGDVLDLVATAAQEQKSRDQNGCNAAADQRDG